MCVSTMADAMVSIADDLYVKGCGKALGMTLRMEWSDTENDREVGGFLTIVCYAPNNYMSVYASFNARYPLPGESGWTLVSRHDSAWRDDGVRNTVNAVGRRLIEEAAKRFGLRRPELSEYLHLDHLWMARIEDMVPEGKRPAQLGRFEIDASLAVRGAETVAKTKAQAVKGDSPEAIARVSPALRLEWLVPHETAVHLAGRQLFLRSEEADGG